MKLLLLATVAATVVFDDIWRQERLRMALATLRDKVRLDNRELRQDAVDVFESQLVLLGLYLKEHAADNKYVEILHRPVRY